MSLRLNASIRPQVTVDRFDVVASLATIPGVELVTVVFPDSDNLDLSRVLVIDIDRDYAVSAIAALNNTKLLEPLL